MTAAPRGVGLVVLCALALAACGAQRAVRAPAPSGAIGQAQARRLASAINLDAGDLPAYRAVPGQSAWSPQAGPIRTCLGSAAPVAVATSSQYTSTSTLSGGQISSATSVFPSDQGARRLLGDLRSQRAVQCLQESARANLTPASALSHAKLQPSAQITLLPLTVTGAHQVVGYRIALTAEPRSQSQQQFSIYVDLLGFATGPALTELVAISTGQLPPPSTEQRLVDLLARRARSRMTALSS